MIGIIIDANSQDETFPNKIYHRFSGKTILDIVIESALRCEYAHKVIVSLPSTDRSAIMGSTFKDPIVSQTFDTFKRKPIYYFSNASSSLDRTYNAALELGIDTIVKISADCPLLPTWLYAEMILYYQSQELNCHLVNFNLGQEDQRLYQDGLNIEIMPFWLLTNIMLYCENKNNYYKYIIENKLYRYFNKDCGPKDIDLPDVEFDLRFKSRNQISQFDEIIRELSIGADLEEILTELNNERR